jgi:hypothetical protein
VAWVLKQLRKHSLFPKAEKSEFFKSEVWFLWLIISGREVKKDPKELETVKERREPSSVKQIQAFLGFLNFYRPFIKGFSGIARPLLDTTLKERSVGSFQLTEDARAAFQQLKETMLKTPVIRQFDPDCTCTVYCDSSRYAISGIVSQPDSDGFLHPVSFYSSSLEGPELRWPIFNKEVFAIFKTHGASTMAGRLARTHYGLSRSRKPAVLLLDPAPECEKTALGARTGRFRLRDRPFGG